MDTLTAFKWKVCCRNVKTFLWKGSYDAISSFPFSLECYKRMWIDKIPEVAKTKVSNLKRYSSKVKTLPRPPKTAHSNTPPHVYITVWKYLRKARERRLQSQRSVQPVRNHAICDRVQLLMLAKACNCFLMCAVLSVSLSKSIMFSKEGRGWESGGHSK